MKNAFEDILLLFTGGQKKKNISPTSVPYLWSSFSLKSDLQIDTCDLIYPVIYCYAYHILHLYHMEIGGEERKWYAREKMMLSSFISCPSFLPAGIFAYFIPSMRKTFNHEIDHKQFATNRGGEGGHKLFFPSWNFSIMSHPCWVLLQRLSSTSGYCKF